MRIKTGCEGLDKLIEGGFPEKQVYLMSGPPGGGKTTLGVQFLVEGTKIGEVGLYVSLLEQPVTVIKSMSRYSLDLVNLVKEKMILFVDMTIHEEAPEDLTANSILDKITKVVEKYDVKRIVLDSILAIRKKTEDGSKSELDIFTFIQNLSALNCTTLLLSEMVESNNFTMEQFACHGVIFLHHFLLRGKMTRALQIIKMRGTKIDCDMWEFAFGENGIEIQPNKISTG
jgi:KaiC/GvpD/RAD55 family RecA-like ATPase